MLINNIIIKPKLTEKSLKNTKNMMYAFEVAKKANKNQIKQAVETLYKVEVAYVQTAIKKGKERRVGKSRLVKKLPDKKIAYIALNKGKIDIFPQE